MQCYSEESGRAGVTLRYVMLSYFFWVFDFNVISHFQTARHWNAARYVALRYVTLLLCYVT